MKSKVKTSYGVALCRKNIKKNNEVEILLIKKRYSYAFFSFVFGMYKKSETKYLKKLFDNMSFSEKIDILGMQFSNMWYRIWLNNPEKRFNIRDIYEIEDDKKKIKDADIYRIFFKKKTKFEKNFMTDMGKKLRNYIYNSNNTELMWEIPKGNKNENETDIDCAMREFFEETSIPDTKYQIYHNIPPIIETIEDNDVIYKNIYYVARPLTDIEPRINFKNFNQISEVEHIKWVSINEIKFMNLHKETHERLINLYKTIIKKFKSQNKPIKKMNIKY